MISDIELEISQLLKKLDPWSEQRQTACRVRVRSIRQMTVLLKTCPEKTLAQVHPEWITGRHSPADFGTWPVMSTRHRFRVFSISALPYLSWQTLEKVCEWLITQCPGVLLAHCYCDAWRNMSPESSGRALQWLRFKLCPELSEVFCAQLPILAASDEPVVAPDIVHALCRRVENGEF